MKIEGDVNIVSLMHKFKRGINTLSHVKWVSASGFHFSVAGVLGIAGLILAARDGKIRNFNRLPWSWAEGEHYSEEFWVVPGLQNLGNNCFLNVILQALASCLYFQDYLHNIIGECGSLLFEERAESLPLTVTLASLLEELCTVQHGRMALSPRKVMLAMDNYLPNFNLANQQDAEEAFLHLLSSLREEFFDSNFPNHSSLADVIAFSNCRILTPEKIDNQADQERWQQHFLGPFDGILSSILTCQSCSFQISLDFEFFHSLHLSPVLNNGATIMAGFTMEDCLKQFIVAEKVEHYHCNRCWHIAAIKYLSTRSRNETDIEKLGCCSEQDSCDCKNIFGLEALPWSNSFPRVFKQVSIMRCPKILCIHLQRASMNGFGELVKLQGHISFPLILELSPFLNSGVGLKNWEDNIQRGQATQKFQQSSPHINHFNMPFDTHTLNTIYGQMGKSIYSEAAEAEELKRIAFKLSCNTYLKAFQEEQKFPQTEGCSNTTLDHMHLQSKDKVGGTCQLAHLDSHTYQLVSVVEHFGKAGSGHYIVYRRVRAKSGSQNLNGQPNGLVRWYCISDSEVHTVSEMDVLAAEASLLYYEKMV